jgi:transposase
MEDYKKQVLEAVVGPAFEHGWGQEEGLFHEDNAPIHGTRGGLKIRKQELGMRLFDWPPNSPDLSPLENVWRLLNSVSAVDDSLLGPARTSYRQLRRNGTG